MSGYLIDHIKQNLTETLNHIKKDFKNQKLIKVLDLGCGNKPYEGLVINYLKNVEYIGIDYYNENADIKLDLNKDELPFKDNEIDFIICTEVLERLYNPYLLYKGNEKSFKTRRLYIPFNTIFFVPFMTKNMIILDLQKIFI